MAQEHAKSIEWRFATKGLYVYPWRVMSVGFESDPKANMLYGVEIASAKYPENARLVESVLNAILDGEAGVLPSGCAVRLARFTVWEGNWVVATNARGQSTMITKRPSAADAKELVDKLNAALDMSA